MSNKETPGFFDSKTLLAVILVGIFWLGWQFYMQSKYPDLYKKKEEISENREVMKDSLHGNKEIKDLSLTKHYKSENSLKSDEISGNISLKHESFNYSDEIWAFDISPVGMGIENIRLKDYRERDGSEKRMGSERRGPSFATNLVGQSQPLLFDIKKTSDNEFVGLAQFGNISIEKILTINSREHFIDTKVLVRGVSEEIRFSGLTTTLAEDLKTPDSGIPFLPAFEVQEIYSLSDGQDYRMLFSKEDEGRSLSKIKLTAISTQYFTQAFLDKSDVMPEAKVNLKSGEMFAEAVITHNLINRSQDFFVNYISFVGPKSFDLLSKVDENMAAIIDFGWFGGLAKLILSIMKYFFSVFGNWGLAIVLLTLLVRILVLPFNLMSFRSMKKMQELQPQIKEMREKYKEDPQKLNQEMMTLFKTHKANPLGGCLPMLLQFPVFIALYRMLGQSIELYQAPFVFWIQDLSLKDPYFVLPVLMGLTMFAQQKLTPSTMDPAQQKIFMVMPIVFALFMVTLPSGLTLYIFVSALFAVIQQFIMMRDGTKITV